MPQIPEFTAQSPGITAPESGVEAFAMAGRRIGAFYHQTGQNLAGAISGASREAQEYIDHQEMSHGAVAEAGMLSDLTDKWNAVVSDPNFDPNNPVAAKQFRDQVLEPALENFSNSFHTTRGQEWALNRTERIRDHFFEQTAADVSTMAGIAAVTNAQKLGNARSNIVARNPSAAGFMIDTEKEAVEALVPQTVKGPQRAKIVNELTLKHQEEHAKAAVYGAIMNSADPEKAAADGTRRYTQYINGVEADQMAKAAKAQAKSLEVQSRSAQLLKKQQDQLAVDAQANDTWNKNVTVDANGKTTINPNFFKEITRLPGQFPDAVNALNTARTYLDWGQSQLRERREVVVSDPGTKTQLYSGIFDAESPTTTIDILRAEANDRLSSRDGTILRQLAKEVAGEADLKGEVWNATRDAAKRIIAPGIPGVSGPASDAKGAEAYATFLQRFVPEYLKQKRAGTLQPNAMDLNDPKSLISQTIAPLKMNVRDRLQGQIDQYRAPSGTGTMLTKPGETITGTTTQELPAVHSADDYMKLKPGQQYLDPGGNLRTKH